MESSHLVIFSTSGKFITKFNVLRCISLSETLFGQEPGVKYRKNRSKLQGSDCRIQEQFSDKIMQERKSFQPIVCVFTVPITRFYPDVITG